MLSYAQLQSTALCNEKLKQEQRTETIPSQLVCVDEFPTPRESVMQK